MILPRKAILEMKPYDPPTSERKGKLRLDFNENTIGCSPKVIKAIQKATAEDICTYPDYGKFKKKLAKYLNVDCSEVLLTNGTDEAIKVVMDAYIEKGNEILLPVPAFAMFSVYASIVGGKVTPVLYNVDLSFPAEEILKKITNLTRLVVLVNPNNPTGTAISEEDVIRIAEKAKNSVVLIDEAYYQYYGKSSKNLIEKYDNMIVIQTFSKAFGLAGLRLGYIIANRETIAILQKVVSPYSVNSLALLAGNAALNDLAFVNAYVAEVKESKAYVEKELGKLGVKAYPSEANFIIANFGDSCDYVCSKLKEKDILIRNRTRYLLLKNCLRIGIGTKQQSLMLVRELKKIMRKRVLLFDLDGVLVDVSNSYRLAIKKTAEFFTKQEIMPDEIQELKEKGGYNNDWDLSEAVIRLKSAKAAKKDVVKKFQEFYLGSGEGKGFINNEKWLLSREVLAEVYRKYRLGIVTGRPKEEAYYVLKRFEVLEYFDSIVTMDDYPKGRAKPDPSSINLALKQLDCRRAVYFGDSIDDIKAARNARLKAVGVLPPSVSSDKLETLLKANGAKIVLKNIDDIKEALK